MSESPPPYLPTAYPSEDHPAGYMPQSEVYGVIDFILHCASDTESSAISTTAARAFIARWQELGPTPTQAQLQAARLAMADAAAALSGVFDRSLAGFLADLDLHPSPAPGSVFGVYHVGIEALKLRS